MLYLGSDVSLPTSDWKKDSPGFFLSNRDVGIEKAKRHFTTEYVYYAGSHEGCVCGFAYDQYMLQEDYEKRRSSVQSLVQVIEQVLLSSSPVELFVAWAGYEKKNPIRSYEMNPEELLSREFPLDENDFVTFRNQ